MLAVTIHKCQGLTLPEIVVDMLPSKGTFSPVNGPISHKSQCIHSVVPQLKTTLTSQPSQLLMYLP